MKLNDIKRFSAYVRTIYHSEYITLLDVMLKCCYDIDGISLVDIFLVLLLTNLIQIDSYYLHY